MNVRTAVLAGLTAVTLAIAPRASGASAADTLASGTPISSRPYVLAPYDSLADAARYVTRADYERVRGDLGISIRRVTYASNGLEVAAIVATPRRLLQRRPPLVLFGRGGYTVGDAAWQNAALFGDLVRAGYVVVAPMLRGSNGAAGHDEMGGADLDDFLNAIPLAHALGIADTTRLYLAGESRGGVMVYLALRRGVPALAAAAWGAFSDLDSLVTERPDVYDRVAPAVWADWDSNRVAIAESRSAARWAGDLGAPLLVLHGGADIDVAPRHSVEMAAALERAGRPYRLQIFGGATHTLKEFTAERDRLLADWFDQHPAPRRVAAP